MNFTTTLTPLACALMLSFSAHAVTAQAFKNRHRPQRRAAVYAGFRRR